MNARLCLLAGLILVATGWTAWMELAPRTDRALRIQVRERLEAWFPEQMTPPPVESGFVRDGAALTAPVRTEVVLVHGLDEPGGIWAELEQRLDREGIAHLEFRYPNDQAIDASADELAAHWPELETGKPIYLVGHSMGGLVIRDFVSRHRHPVKAPPKVGGPKVGGVILIATPNQGSQWARLRAFLELREFAADLPAGRFSLFASLRDGTGAARVDLRPGSQFLRELDARPWPEAVPIRIIGGRIAEPTPVMEKSVAELSEELGLPELETTYRNLWAETGQSLGDGAVPVSSLSLDEAPPPLVLPATHRGLIAPMPFSDGPPPAIEPVIEYLKEWGDSKH